jgi:predicted nuclease of predicted toxin-antitoxin system
MRFVLDQSTDARIIAYLREQGHDATRVARDYAHGLPDTQVLAIAHAERRILIADDPDFGELVFRLGQPHAGVIFLRLGPYADLAFRVARLHYVLTHYGDQLDQFLVVTPRRVRVRRR